jgi:predicted small lipoprotein YifL
MRRFVFALAATSFVFLFAGCGQSGPLYLPGDPSKIESQPAPEDADVEKQEEEKEKVSEAPAG